MAIRLTLAMTRPPRHHQALALALVLATTACSDDPAGPDTSTPASISLSTTSVTLTALGATAEVIPTIKSASGATITWEVGWASNDRAIATVSESGVITAVANGTTQVRATAGPASATVAVTVQQQIAGLTLTTDTATLEALGVTRQLEAVATDAAGSVVANAQLTWTSSDTNVVDVSADGTVTAVRDGEATITVSSGPAAATAAVTVRQRAAAIELSDSSLTAGPGSSVAIEAYLVDAGGSPLAAAPVSVAWVSDRPDVASVSGAGVVTLHTPGVAVLTVTINEFSATVDVLVGDDGGDLGVGWIHRSPAMDFVWGSTNPTRDGWPTEGQTVTWVAMVKNWSAYDRDGIRYRWTVDDVEVASGTIDLPAGVHTAVGLPRSWSFSRAVLGFEIDPDDAVAETEESNNNLDVFTDALSVGFYVEQSVYDYFALNQSRLGIGSNSWEDWAQRHIRMWNEMFAAAQFPLTPDGVLDRLRLDRITIVPDGALPLAGGLPSNMPNANDRSVDLQWGFATSLLGSGMYDNLTSASTTNPFYFEGSLLHELGHARYLIDVYGFNVIDGQWTPGGIVNRGANVAIMEDGVLIAGTLHMPVAAWEVLFYTPMPGLMNGQYTEVDEYSAAALNVIAGRRAVYGNMNAPGNIGVFMNDLPSENRLTVRDWAGNVLAGAAVAVYQAGPMPQWYGKYYDNTPDLLLSADAQGRVLLGRNPFSSTGGIVHTYGHANSVIIIRVEHGGRLGYGFLESWRFNMAYWGGTTAIGDYELRVTLH